MSPCKLSPFPIPDYLRVVLLLLSIASFIPSIHHLTSQQNSSGISLLYILLNLIATTEQFTLTFFYTVTLDGQSDFFTHKRVQTGDWLNFAQMGVVLGCWLVLFTLTLHLPTPPHPISSLTKRETLLTYLFAFSLTLLPLLCDQLNPARENDRMWFIALFGGAHLLYISWLIPFLPLLSLYFQVRETLSRPVGQGLSSMALGAQAVVFLGVAVSWVGRVVFPVGGGGEGWSWGAGVVWYQMVGWAAVGSAVFSAVQGVLCWVAWRHERREGGRVEEEGEGDEETGSEPLLSEEGEIEPLLPERAATYGSMDRGTISPA